MAKPGLLTHPKFLRLSHVLGSRALALGCLELLWLNCYERGSPDVGDATDVAMICGQRDGEALIKALIECGGPGRPGFIEPVPDQECRYRVHDLAQHAPQYAQRRLRRATASVDSRAILSQLRAEAGRRGGLASGVKRRARIEDDESKQTVSNLLQDEANPSKFGVCCQANEATPSIGPKGKVLEERKEEEAARSKTTDSDHSQSHRNRLRRVPDGAPTAAEFRAHWNALDRVQQCDAMTGSRAAKLAELCQGEYFRANWRRAVDRINTVPFLRSHPEGWKPTVDWFLADGRVVTICEGKYDPWEPPADAKTPRDDGLCERRDPTDEEIAEILGLNDG